MSSSSQPASTARRDRGLSGSGGITAAGCDRDTAGGGGGLITGTGCDDLTPAGRAIGTGWVGLRTGLLPCDCGGNACTGCDGAARTGSGTASAGALGGEGANGEAGARGPEPPMALMVGRRSSPVGSIGGDGAIIGVGGLSWR